MKKIIPGIAILLLLFHITCSKESAETPLYEMTPHQIDSLITAVSRKNLTVTERMQFYSQRFLGMPYKLTCAGDGPYALYEAWPLVTFDYTNCMVFCEHVLALSISDSWDNFFNNLQQIRYRDGMIGMRTRNHYTMGDWLPENRWLLDDVSRAVGAEHTIQVTRTISHADFFRGKGISDLRHVQPDRDISIDVVPKEALLEIEENTRNGDVLALIFANKDNIFSAHMLMLYKEHGQTIIRESSSSKMTTFDTPYAEWVAKIQESPRYLGLCFMRVREEINQPGTVILPWEIGEMKD